MLSHVSVWPVLLLPAELPSERLERLGSLLARLRRQVVPLLGEHGRDPVFSQRLQVLPLRGERRPLVLLQLVHQPLAHGVLVGLGLGKEPLMLLPQLFL